jgi:hypothetical protein
VCEVVEVVALNPQVSLLASVGLFSCSKGRETIPLVEPVRFDFDLASQSSSLVSLRRDG